MKTTKEIQKEVHDLFVASRRIAEIRQEFGNSCFHEISQKPEYYEKLVDEMKALITGKAMQVLG